MHLQNRYIKLRKNNFFCLKFWDNGQKLYFRLVKKTNN